MTGNKIAFSVLLLTLVAAPVCHVSGLDPLVLPGVGDTAQCEDCKWLATTAETYLMDPTNQQLVIQFVVTNVCPQLQDPLRQQCLSYTPILIPTAVLWLSTNFPPNIVCADLAMCEAAKALQSLMLQKPSDNGIPCPMCKFVLTQILVQLQDPNNQETILAGALQMCSLLEPNMQPDCQSNIEQISTSSWQMSLARKAFIILADVSVDKACIKMKACEPMPPLRQVVGMSKSPTALDKVGRDVAQMLKMSDGQCEECQMVSAELKSLLSNPDTRQRIKDGLKDACGVLQVYESTCNEAVNDYADLAFNVALQYVQDPRATCVQLGICTGPAAVTTTVV